MSRSLTEGIHFLQKKAAMERETAAQGSDNTMQVIEREFAQNKDAVIEMLIENCMAVDTSIPRVVRGKFDEAQWADCVPATRLW